MKLKIPLTVALAGLALAATLVLGGCLVRTVAVVGPEPPVEYGYQPMLYNGYVVYYTDDGVPFYWDGGVQIFVPLAYRTVYINHWHSHRGAYSTWYHHRGNYYRTRHYRSHRDKRDSRPVLTPRRDDSRESKPQLRPKKKKDKKDEKKTLQPKK